MGSLRQDDFPATEKESAPIFIESECDLSKNGILDGESEVQNRELGNGLLKDEPEVQDVKSGHEPLKDNPKLKRLERLNEQLKDRLDEIRTKIPVIMKDEKWEDRMKFMKSSIKRLKKEDEFLQVDNIGTSPAKLKDIFPNLNLTQETPKEFKIHVDCQQFNPMEIKVVVKPGSISVHCSHQMKPDDHGYIAREFKRSWPIPENVKQEEFTCFLNRYGILTLRAPRKEGSIAIPLQKEKDFE